MNTLHLHENYISPPQGTHIMPLDTIEQSCNYLTSTPILPHLGVPIPQVTMISPPVISSFPDLADPTPDVQRKYKSEHAAELIKQADNIRKQLLMIASEIAYYSEQPFIPPDINHIYDNIDTFLKYIHKNRSYQARMESESGVIEFSP